MDLLEHYLANERQNNSSDEHNIADTNYGLCYTYLRD